MGKILNAADIVKTVAIKHNVTTKAVEEILNKSIDYMAYLINTEYTPSIQLPYLGCLYFKNRERNVDLNSARSSIKQTRSINERLVSKINRNERIYLNIEKYLDSLSERPNFQGKRKVRHYTKPFIAAKKHTFDLPIEKIEEIQNEHNQ